MRPTNPKYHNFRLTRKLPDGTFQEESELHLSLKDAVEDDVLDNKGVVNVALVEWRGAQIGPEWRDVTDTYRNLYSEMTSDGR